MKQLFTIDPFSEETIMIVETLIKLLYVKIEMTDFMSL